MGSTLETQYEIGSLCSLGQVSPSIFSLFSSNKEAAKLYRKATDQGHANAQFHLGLMIQTGKDRLQDYKQANMILYCSIF